jgi:RimJ/RimL family protein N-acetyltransferase
MSGRRTLLKTIEAGRICKMENLFLGKLVRLAADNPEPSSQAFMRWRRNSQFLRLLDSEAPLLWSAKEIKDWIEKDLEKDTPGGYYFKIHALEDDRLIGFVGLRGILWSQRDAWAGIGIGEPEYWGRGYGTEAMRLALRYAFLELSLERVSLSVFVSNNRAVRSYEKAGFKPEGIERQVIRRDGIAEDILYMGILRQEWLAQNGGGENHAEQ